MKSYTIHLIRHGISQGNLLGQYIGVTDSPLSKEGKEQVCRLKTNGHLIRAKQLSVRSSLLYQSVESLRG